jgi:hypothetical protein
MRPGLAHADDFSDEEELLHDLADGATEGKLGFLISADRTLTLPPVTWVDQPPRASKLHLPEQSPPPPPLPPPLALPPPEESPPAPPAPRGC